MKKPLPTAGQKAAGKWWYALPAGYAMPGPLIICGRCSSALDVAHFFVSHGLFPVWSGLLAVAQECGRGQARRFWHSPAGNIYAVFRWPRPAKAWENLLPLVTAYWTVRVLESFGLPARIKWPNDIFLQGKKAGGILVEERREQGEDRILVGVGINYASAAPQEVLRRDGAHPATCLREHFISGMPVPTVLDIWHGLASMAKNEYSVLDSSAVSHDFLASVEQYLVWLGQKVRVCGYDGPPAQKSMTGIFSGLTEKGEAVVVHEGVSSVMHSGSLQREV